MASGDPLEARGRPRTGPTIFADPRGGKGVKLVKETEIVKGFRNPRSMPPSKKQRTAQPPHGSTAAGAAPGAAAGGRQQRKEAKECGLQSGVVKEFLEMIQRRDRLGPDFFNDDEKRKWDQFLDGVPASAAESADGKTLLPVQMPRKCKARAEGCAGSSTSTGQQEIITYTNAGGRQFQTADRQRQHAASKPLRLADVPQGSAVAIKRDPEAASADPGYNTPFYIGDVIDAVTDQSGMVKKVTIHYRMPQGADGLFCDDLKKGWNLACHAQHKYTKACERWRVCRAAAAKAGSDSAKFVYTCDAAEVFETKLAFNESGTLKAASKKRLAESAPEQGAWNVRLGLA